MPAKKKTKSPTLKERRTQKREAIASILDELTIEFGQIQQNQKQADLLTSVTQGLYEELDKLSKKAPVDEATELVVESVNDVIKDIHVLSPNDAYIQRVKPFVPAGNNPEHRDVILILKQLSQGLKRSIENLKNSEGRLKAKIGVAKGLLVALDLYLQSNETQITEDDLKEKGVNLPSKWWGKGNIYGDEKTVELTYIDKFDETLLRNNA